MFLVDELIKSKIDFEVHNIALNSAGNHLIADLYKEKITELLKNGVSPKNIIGTIQLSSLCRPTHSLENEELLKKYEWDYIDNLDKISFDFKTLLTKHIENIENLIEFNKKNKITKFKLFFGWAIFFKDELVDYKLYDRVKAIEDYLYYEEYSLFGKTNLLNTSNSKGEFGGINEYCLQNLNVDEHFYCSKTDSHINSFGNLFFYENVYRTWFLKWKIFKTKEYQKENKLDFISKKAQQSFLDSYKFDFDDSNVREKLREIYLKEFWNE